MSIRQIKEKLMKVPVKYWLAILFVVLYVICLCLFIFTDLGRALLMAWGFVLVFVGGAIGLFYLWEHINVKLENRNKVKEFEENDDEMMENTEKNE